MSNTVEYTCKGCNVTYQITKQSFKRRKTEYCRNCCSINTQKDVKRPQFSNESSGRWKGGSYISSDGYKMIKVEGEFTEGGRQVYKREHVINYEKSVGINLNTSQGNMGEQLHHVDGNKLNNDLSNLEFCSDTRQHQLLHVSLEECAFELVRKGVIKFNKELKKYYL